MKAIDIADLGPRLQGLITSRSADGQQELIKETNRNDYSSTSTNMLRLSNRKNLDWHRICSCQKWSWQGQRPKDPLFPRPSTPKTHRSNQPIVTQCEHWHHHYHSHKHNHNHNSNKKRRSTTARTTTAASQQMLQLQPNCNPNHNQNRNHSNYISKICPLKLPTKFSQLFTLSCNQIKAYIGERQFDWWRLHSARPAKCRPGRLFVRLPLQSSYLYCLPAPRSSTNSG